MNHDIDGIRFDGQVVLVTGAGRGLGRAYATLLGSRGAHVIVHDAGVDRDGTGSDPSVAEAVVAQIRQLGGAAEAAVHDLGVPGSATRLVADVERSLGRLDAVVHSAGISIHATLAETDDPTLDRILAINGRAAIELVKAAIPVMERRRYGRIVLTVSGHGLYPTSAPDLVPYAVSKAMQYGLMNGLADDLVAAGICVNAVSPVAATRMLTRAVPPGSLRPEDVAPVVAYLASSRCRSAGLVVRAAGGRFSIGRYSVTAGADLSAGGASITPEAVAAAWSMITRGPFEDADG